MDKKRPTKNENQDGKDPASPNNDNPPRSPISTQKTVGFPSNLEDPSKPGHSSPPSGPQAPPTILLNPYRKELPTLSVDGRPSQMPSTYSRPSNLPYLLTKKQRLYVFCRLYWKTMLIIVLPFILLPVITHENTPAFRFMYLLLMMAILWMLTLLPLPVTALLPIALFPPLGILDSTLTCEAYMRDSIMMFVGGLMLALGIQYSGLPKRLALKMVIIVGCSHYRLVYSLSFVTMFLSMWISNAASTIMMAPIILAVLEVLESSGLGSVYVDKVVEVKRKRGDPLYRLCRTLRWKFVPPKLVLEDEEAASVVKKHPSDVTICYFLLVAYSSSLGGMATLVGTPTNMVYKGILETRFPDAPPVDFAAFMSFSVPPLLVIHTLTYFWMIYYLMGFLRPNSEQAKRVHLEKEGIHIMRRAILQQYDLLGPISFGEKSACALLVMVVGLFLTRSPGFITGWGDVISPNKYIGDSCAAIFTVLVMFIVPTYLQFKEFFKRSNVAVGDLPKESSPGLLSWPLLQEKVYWELIFLLGGGLALAAASKSSGLSAVVAGWLSGLDAAASPVLVLAVMLLAMQMLTQICSNVATASILLPIIAEMALVMHVNPIVLMLPCTLSTSFAFHTPVGTAANAIVCTYVNIPPKRMFTAGFGPSVISFVVLIGSTLLYNPLVDPQLSTLPAWAK